MTARISVSPIDRLANSIKAIHDRLTAVERALGRNRVPAGTYIEGVWATAPPGYLMMNQTVVNAQTIYPALWAVAPVGWRSGSNLVLPARTDSAIKT